MGLLVLQPTKHHTKPKRCQTQPGTEVVRALGQSFPVVCRARWRPGCIQNAPRGRARRQAPWPPHRCARLPPASEHACRRSPPSLDLLCVGVACTLCHTSAMCVCVSVCVCARKGDCLKRSHAGSLHPSTCGVLEWLWRRKG